MQKRIKMKNVTRSFISALFALSISPLALATTVQFQTNLGNFEVNLLDDEAPITVANFLTYVEDGDYQNSVIHRLIYNFVLQGGGWIPDTENSSETYMLKHMDADAAIVNEPKYSNVRGTIAMAKLGGDEDSATSEWFINLADNSANLDYQNGGFTVFGYVDGDGMDVIDEIAKLNTVNFTGFQGLPLLDYSDEDAASGVPLEEENFVFVENIVVIDAAANTAEGHQLAEIVALPEEEEEEESGGSNGAGSSSWPMLLMLGVFAFCLRRKKS